MQSSIGFIILGATSDWARKEQLVALYTLFIQGTVPPFRILCVARSIKSRQDYLKKVAKGIIDRLTVEGMNIPHPDELERFFTHIDLVEDENGAVTAADSGSTADWDNLIGDTFRKKTLPSGGQAFILLSIPPNAVEKSTHAFGASELSRDELICWNILLEKPFGNSAKTAKKLYDDVLNATNWGKVALVDHYLARYTMQNINAMFRENALYQLAWNSSAINRIEIVALEDDNLNARWQTYEGMSLGALDDMLITHLINSALVLALPHELRSRDTPIAEVTAAKLKLAQTMEILELAYGQYGAGEINGVHTVGYREIAPELSESTTPTYVGIKLVFHYGCLAGVPFYIQTGKALKEKRTHINAFFAPPATSDSKLMQRLKFVIFNKRGRSAARGVVQQEVVVRGTALDYMPSSVTHEIDVRELLGGTFFLPYAKALFDAIRGHWQNFVAPEVQIAIWEKLDPPIWRYKHATKDKRPLTIYAAGSRFVELPWWQKNGDN